MKYFLAGTWVNDSTISSLPIGATPLTDAEWLARNSTPYIKTPAEKQAEANAAAKAALALIDAASIRAIREYIASKADAPQLLKDREAAAGLERAKIKL